MIIRLTVKDNDFSDKIEIYFRDFWLRMLELHADAGIDEKSSGDNLNAWRMREKKIRTIMNPNSDIELTDEDKRFIISQVEKTFSQFVEHRCPNDAEYLKRKLEVSILKTFEDKWENGEVYYWFQHSDKAICQ